jgi:hypothetical protein
MACISTSFGTGLAWKGIPSQLKVRYVGKSRLCKGILINLTQNLIGSDFSTSKHIEKSAAKVSNRQENLDKSLRWADIALVLPIKTTCTAPKLNREDDLGHPESHEKSRGGTPK